MLLHMRGKLDDLLMTASPEIYLKYIIVNKKGENVINVKSLNNIYGVMNA